MITFSIIGLELIRIVFSTKLHVKVLLHPRYFSPSHRSNHCQSPGFCTFSPNPYARNVSKLPVKSSRVKNASRMLELATQIVENTTIVNDYLIASNHPQPSFNIDGPTDLVLKSTDAEKARMACIGASIELQDLMQGPKACLAPTVKRLQDHHAPKNFFPLLTTKAHDH